METTQGLKDKPARRGGDAGLSDKPERVVLTPRDRELVRWVYVAKLATREQLQQIFFSTGGRSRCQHRLTLLYRHRFLDKLPGRLVNSPDVYYLSRRATKGLRLLRALHPEETVRPYTVHRQMVQHTLDIASCHIALQEACEASGYRLVTWLTEGKLARQMGNSGLMPDAYCQIERPTDDGSKRACFFLEVERSVKAERAQAEKFRRYGAFYYEGGYEAVFGTRALRVLVLVGSDYGIQPAGYIGKLAALATKLGTTMVRFAPLETFLTEEPEELFCAPIWRQPGSEVFGTLF